MSAKTITRRQKTVTARRPVEFMGDTVSVKLLKDGKGAWRVTAWGPDDLGFERTGDLDACLTIFHKIGAVVSAAQLIAFGFVRA